MVDTANLSIKVDSRDVKKADKDLDGLAGTAKKTEKATDSLGAASKGLSKSFKLQKGAAQQVGFQLQDFAVQVSSGTSALTAFGQQGSQLAGIMGPGGALLGAVIAIGSALGGVLFSSISNATDEMDELNDSVQAFIDKTDRVQSRKLISSISEIKNQIKSLDMALQSTDIEELERLTGLDAGFFGVSRADLIGEAQVKLRDYIAALKIAKEELNKLNDGGSSSRGIGMFGPTIEDFDAEMMRRFGEQEKAAKATEALAKRAAEKAAQTQKKFISDFEQLRDRLDPVGADLRRFARDVGLIQEAFRKGLITQAQADKLVNRLNAVSDAASDEFTNAFVSSANRISESIADALVTGDWDSLGSVIGGVIGASVSEAISEEITKNLSKSLSAESGALSQISAAFAGPLAGAIAGAGIQIAVNEALSGLSNSFGNDSTAADNQASQGTGTVLGDVIAKSESIANATEITAEATSELVGINRDMLTALQSVQAGISGAVTRIARGADDVSFGAPGFISGDSFQSSIESTIGAFTLGLGSSILDVLSFGLFSKVGKLFGGSSKKTDEGINILGGTISDLINETIVQAYASFKTKKTRFSRTKSSTQFQNLDNEVNQQFELVFESIAGSVAAGAEALGLSAGEIQSKLDSFVVATQSISLKGLKPEEQAQAIQEVFGTIFDDLSLTVIPFLDDFQKAGEGLGETLARVATNVQVTEAAVDRLGLTFDNLSGESLVTASTRLVEFAGGVGEFTKSVGGFISNFATDEKKLELVTSDLTRALEEQGLVIPKTREGYWELLKAQNASSESGAENVALLLRLQGVADEYYDFLENAAEAATEAAEALASAAIAAAEAAHQAAMSVSDTALDAIRAAVENRKSEIVDAYNVERDLITSKHSAEIDAIKESSSAQLSAIKASRSAQLQVNKASISAVKGSLSLINKEVGGISSALSRLIGETDAIQSMTREAALAKLRSGNLSGAGEAAGIAANISAEDFATAAGFERAQGTTRVLLEGLEKSGMARASAAERTIEKLERQTETINYNSEKALAQAKILSELSLDAATERHEKELAELDRMHESDLSELDLVLQTAIDQLNVLRGIDTSVLSLGDALAAFASALTVESQAQLDVPGFASGGSHSGGVRLVGENGPELEFTGPSRIMNNSDSKGLLSNDELINELRELRNEMKASQFAIAKNTGKTSKQLARWDTDGLPAERT